METNILLSVEILKNGGIIAFPTETVYGLGGDASCSSAISKIYKIKGRPAYNPLIIHILNMKWAEKYGIFNETADILATEFWKGCRGALTIIVPKKLNANLANNATAGLETVALRVPSHPIARKLLQEFGGAIAAPSANISGKISPTTAVHIEEEFNGEIPILYGDSCDIGLESTIVDCTKHGIIRILREGSITQEMLEKFTVINDVKTDKILASGMLKSHYSPSVKIRLNVEYVGENEALLAFGDNYPMGAKRVLNLSESSNLKEAARNLFNYMRELDKCEFTAIAVSPIPNIEIGRAINDRLSRAAAEK